MKVRIALTVEVDAEDWASTYGIDADAATVREDVREWTKHMLLAHPDGLVNLP